MVEHVLAKDEMGVRFSLVAHSDHTLENLGYNGEMQKLKIGGVIMGSLLIMGLVAPVHAEVTSSTVSSATIAELQQKIQSLIQQIQELQQKLRAIQGGNASSTGAFNPGLHLGEIKHNICFGAKNDDDVRTLQQQLHETGHFNSDATGNFGPMTQEAVMHFQRDHHIPPANCAGPLTRDALIRLKMGSTTSPIEMREIKITPEALRVFRVGVLSGERLMAHGFGTTTELRWDVINGSLPQGFSLFKTTPIASCAQGSTCNMPFDNTIVLQGQPVAVGDYEFTVKVSDGMKSGEQRFVLHVRAREDGPQATTSATVY